MSGKVKGLVGAVVVGIGLLTASPASAIPFGEWWMHKDPNCPRTHYSPCHYWMPRLYTLAAYCHPYLIYTFAKDLHPDLPLRFEPIKYRCPYIDPAIFSTHYVPPPPSVSEGETAPGATTPYQAESPTAREGVTTDPAAPPER